MDVEVYKIKLAPQPKVEQKKTKILLVKLILNKHPLDFGLITHLNLIKDL